MRLRGRRCAQYKPSTSLSDTHPDAWESIPVPEEARSAPSIGRIWIGGREHILFEEEGGRGRRWAMSVGLVTIEEGGGSNADPEQVRVRDLPREKLFCPSCSKQHFDEGVWAMKAHHTHRCVDDAAGPGCGHEWRLDREVFGA